MPLTNKSVFFFLRLFAASYMVRMLNWSQYATAIKAGGDNWQLRVMPCSMFAPDGTLLQASDEADTVHAIES